MYLRTLKQIYGWTEGDRRVEPDTATPIFGKQHNILLGLITDNSRNINSTNENLIIYNVSKAK